MATRFERPVIRSQEMWLLIVATGCLICVGCGRKIDRLEQAYRDTGLTKIPVAPVAGIVTVDGAAPAPFTVVMLWDPKKPEAGVLRTICDSDGGFTFTSYEPGDGVPPGTYVVLFARFNMGRPLGTFDPPDLLNNLYNDPDRNASKPEFQITVDSSGRTDYHFNLTVAGEPPGTPGPHAVTEIKTAM